MITEATRAKMRAAKIGKRLSPATEFKPGQKPSPNRVIHSGKDHYKFQEKPSYIAIHQWINKLLGRPLECENCGFTSDNGRQFNWSNISGEYKREVSDWARLCVRCHHLIDDIKRRGWNTRKTQCV